MKKTPLIPAFIIITLLTLQGCTQIIGATASTAVAVVSVPVKMSAAAASAATHTVIDRVIGK